MTSAPGRCQAGAPGRHAVRAFDQPEPVVRDAAEEQRLLDELAALHRAYEDHTTDPDEFATRRDVIRLKRRRPARYWTTG